jgi:hypothetical protein
MPIISHEFFFKVNKRILGSVHEYVRIIEEYTDLILRPTDYYEKNEYSEKVNYEPILFNDRIFISLTRNNIKPYMDAPADTIKKIISITNNLDYLNIATPYQRYLGYASLYAIGREFLNSGGGVIINNFEGFYQIFNESDLERFYEDNIPKSCIYSYKIAKRMSPKFFVEK